MLRAWVSDNDRSDWLILYRLVQWQKPACQKVVKRRSPYTTLFVTKTKLSTRSTNIHQKILETLESEENLERLERASE